MRGTADEDETILKNRLKLPSLWDDRRLSTDDEINLAARDCHELIFAFRLAQVDSDVWIEPAEFRQHGGQQAVRRGRGSNQPDNAIATQTLRHHRISALGDAKHELARNWHQISTCGGGSYAARVTLEELHLQEALQVRESLRHGRLGQANGLGRALHAAKFAQAKQHLEMAKLATRQ